MKNSLKFNIATVFMIIFWGSAYVAVRAGLKGYSPGALALLRYSVASLCMLPLYWGIYLRQPHRARIKPQELFLVAILGILGFGIYNVALNYGEVSVDAGIASFIISQIPVIITIFAVFLFKERLSSLGWTGTVISFGGISLICISESTTIHLDIGVIILLFAMLVASLYSLFQKPLLRKLHPIAFTALAIWFGTLPLLIYLPQLIHEIPKAPLSITLTVIYNGIFPSAIAYVLWSYVVSILPTSKAASYLYIVPVITTLMGWLFLDEIPAVLSIFGGVIALLGAMMVHRGVKQEKNPIKATEMV